MIFFSFRLAPQPAHAGIILKITYSGVRRQPHSATPYASARVIFPVQQRTRAHACVRSVECAPSSCHAFHDSLLLETFFRHFFTTPTATSPIQILPSKTFSSSDRTASKPSRANHHVFSKYGTLTHVTGCSGFLERFEPHRYILVDHHLHFPLHCQRGSDTYLPLTILIYFHVR